MLHDPTAVLTIADPNGPIEVDLVTDANLERLSQAVTEAIPKN